MKKKSLFLIMLFLSLSAFADDSGTCGENLTWTFIEETSTLTITGTGDMKNYYSEYDVPWWGVRSKIKRIVLNEGITSIGSLAFYSVYITQEQNDTSFLSIPESVSKIGDFAFKGCSVRAIKIPANVSNIGLGVFKSCGYLSKIILPSSITSIGKSAFEYCRSLTSIDLPENVSSIGESAFAHCTSLKTISIPNGVTTIEKSTFYECDSLSSVYLPNSLTTIGDYAFSLCRNLSKINLPNIAIIGKNTFEYCSNLCEIELPNSVYTIGDNAFYGCINLSKINIPNSVNRMGMQMFAFCEKLDSIVIPNSVLGIGGNMFFRCKNLKKAVVCEGKYPEGRSTVGTSLFQGCTSLKEVIIGDNVGHIKGGVFDGCPNLNLIIIGCNLEKLESSFTELEGLRDVYCYTIKPSTADIFSYNLTKTIEATLHVPSASVNSYKEAYYWKNFKEIVPLKEDDPKPLTIVTQNINIRSRDNSYYTIGGQKVGLPRKGINIVRDNNGNTKKAIIK